jgi:hypothetical protein
MMDDDIREVDERIDGQVERRRLLKFGGVAAAGALVGMTAKASPAEAGTDGDVILSADNFGNAQGRTGILDNFSSNEVFGAFNDATSGAAIRGRAHVDAGYWQTDRLNAIGVYGESLDGTGVMGRSSNSTAVEGISDAGAGVAGITGATENPGVLAKNNGLGPAVFALAEIGVGVLAVSTGNFSPAVLGRSQAQAEGVYGQSGLTPGTSAGATRTGIHGVTDSASDAAMWGEAVNGGIGVTGSTTSASNAAVRGANHGSGPGVLGSSTGSGAGVAGTTASSTGIGVFAQNTGGGSALTVSGPSVFSRSGVVTIPSGQTKATVAPPGGLSAAALVLAIMQNVAGGVSVKAAVPNPTAGTFQIVLTKAPLAPATATVAWFVVN